jgi:DNA-binding NarL/FixJ family response regulator
MIRIAILEDDLMTQQSLAKYINDMNGFMDKVVNIDFTVDTFRALKNKLEIFTTNDKPLPDILLIDLLFDQTDRFNGRSVAEYLINRTRYKTIKVIIISSLFDKRSARGKSEQEIMIHQNGIDDLEKILMNIPNVQKCLSKQAIVNNSQILTDAIKSIKRSNISVKAKIESKEKKVKTEFDAFSNLQFEVIDNIPYYELTRNKTPILTMMAEGKTSRQIAECLDTIYQNIDKHIREMKAIFDTKTDAGLITKAFALGVLKIRT